VLCVLCGSRLLQPTAFDRGVREENPQRTRRRARESLLEFLCDLCGFLCVLCGSRLLPGTNEQLLTAEFAKKIRRGREEDLREWLLHFESFRMADWLPAFLCDLCGCPLRALRFKAFTRETLTALRRFFLNARTLRPALPRLLSTQQMPYRQPSAGRHPLAAAETGKNSRW
jgi:hypothetical protein